LTNALLATLSSAIALVPLCAFARQDALAPAGTPAAQGNAPPPATAPLSDPLAVLNGTMPGVTRAQRFEAAQRLLSLHTPEALQALHDALISTDEVAALAVARALAQDPNPNPSFIDPLFPLLDSQAVATAASRALAGYKNDPEVLTRLLDRATSRRAAALFTRRAAIEAVGTIPEKRGAAALYQLLESPDETPEIHKAAAHALMNLTGLDEYGEDATRWTKWWASVRSKPDAQFRSDINALQAARLDRVNAQFEALADAAKKLLSDQYHQLKSASERQDLMLSFLQSPEPDIRKIGCDLLASDVVQGNPISLEERTRLRDMVADSDPGVRRAVADTIRSMNDPDALGALLAQLRVETDPTVKASIAEALGPIHDLRAVPTLITLLSDDSLDTATAAAHSLGDLASDKLPSDPNLAHQTAIALHDIILAKSNSAGSDDFRAACIDALAPLKNTALVQDLLAHKLMDPGKEESAAVRRAMLGAVGALEDGNFAEPINQSLQDPSPEVEIAAIDAMKTNPRAAEYAESVGRLLSPDPARGQAVSDDAWKFLQLIFPSLSEGQLASWQSRLKDDPARQLIALQALAEKQSASKEEEALAATRFAIGEDHMARQEWGDAAASFGAAMKIYDGLANMQNQQAMVQSLIADYMHVLLNDGRYAEAVGVAADRIRRDPSEQSNVGPIIAAKVEELGPTGTSPNLAAARQLIDLASKMSPPLDGKYLDRLHLVAQALDQKKSSLDNPGPIPQSATVDVK
jgi:HEAT repeat protein